MSQPSLLGGPTTLECVFRAEPLPWMAPQSGRTPDGRTIHYSPKIYREYKEALATALRIAWKGEPDVNPFWVRYEFHCTRNGSPKRDWDNLSKAVGDAGNKIVWKDDSQIIECRGVKVFRATRTPMSIIYAGVI